MKTQPGILVSALLSLSTLNLPLSTTFAQGSLTPPGSPAPTMKSLDQIEPRTPISSAPFTIPNSGSYYVTASLRGNPGGITISASGVTLDLMGFELAGGRPVESSRQLLGNFSITVSDEICACCEKLPISQPGTARKE